MAIRKDTILEDDLKRLAAADLPYLTWKNRSFLVTGATGLIGSLAIKALLYISERYELNLHIIGLVRDLQKAEAVLGPWVNSNSLTLICTDLSAPQISYDGSVDYIIHAAAVTTSKLLVTNPVEATKTTLNGTMAILDLAVQKKIKGMVYLSSMEVYGVVSDGRDVREDELGYVDLHAVRSCYPEGKRMCECLCNAYAKEYTVPVCSVRLAQTFGAGVSAGDTRVFAQFAKSAINSTDIILHTDGLSEGNYIYTTDALKAIFLLLDRGTPGQIYNAANEACHTTILDMAKMVAQRICQGNIQVVISPPDNINAMGYAPKTQLRLISEKLRAIGWQPEIGLEEAYHRLIKSLEVAISNL